MFVPPVKRASRLVEERSRASHDGKVKTIYVEVQKFFVLDLASVGGTTLAIRQSCRPQMETKMIKLSIPDMTCSHCAGVVTKAVKSVDPGAIVTVDYATRTVTVESTASASETSKVVEEAGYPNSIQ